MRRLFVTLALILVIALLWLTVVWVPAGGALHTWHAPSGTLNVPDRGVAFLPRWSHQRRPGSKLEVVVPSASREGADVGVTVAWDPAPGVYRLSATGDVATGLKDRTAGPIGTTLQAVPLRCFVPETAGDQDREDCPQNLDQTLAREIASIIDTEAASLAVTLAPDPGRGTRTPAGDSRRRLRRPQSASAGARPRRSGLGLRRALG